MFDESDLTVRRLNAHDFDAIHQSANGGRTNHAIDARRGPSPAQDGYPS